MRGMLYLQRTIKKTQVTIRKAKKALKEEAASPQTREEAQAELRAATAAQEQCVHEIEMMEKKIKNENYAALMAAVYMAVYSNFAEQEKAIQEALKCLPDDKINEATASVVRGLMPETILARRRSAYTDSQRGDLITTPLYSKFHLQLLRITQQLSSHPWALFVTHWCEKYSAKYPNGLNRLFTERQAIVAEAEVDEEPLILYSVQFLFVPAVDPDRDHNDNPPHAILRVLGKKFTYRIYEPELRADLDALIETVDRIETSLVPSVLPAPPPPPAAKKPSSSTRMRAPGDESSESSDDPDH